VGVDPTGDTSYVAVLTCDRATARNGGERERSLCQTEWLSQDNKVHREQGPGTKCRACVHGRCCKGAPAAGAPGRVAGIDQLKGTMRDGVQDYPATVS
jgi:hypothetical protein